MPKKASRSNECRLIHGYLLMLTNIKKPEPI